MSLLDDAILAALEEHGQIEGIRFLSYEVVGCFNRTHVRRRLLKLSDQGVQVIHTAPGKKALIKLNRNSPGYPRRRRRP